jgi:hypothetical protein
VREKRQSGCFEADMAPVVQTVDDVFSLSITGLSWNVLQWLMDTHPSHVDEWRTKLPSVLECNVDPTYRRHA